ncbi:hypothetical protein [Pantoea sp. BAV 3049]|uniref:hypothetical protein n=1 Tax=Pantoea sp. BAV 3049 TaxID=2654188 RepID=UPI00131B1768|nr:hypothetical protein [Pantoea sp. BAV 3049]
MAGNALLFIELITRYFLSIARAQLKPAPNAEKCCFQIKFSGIKGGLLEIREKAGHGKDVDNGV